MEPLRGYDALRARAMDRLREILARHSLLDAWAKFEKRFLQP